MYDEDAFLQLSGIQHFSFCRRQWALIAIEQQWQENLRTVEGALLHEQAHDAFLKEKRGGTVLVRGMPVCSRELGITGACDVVELHEDRGGIALTGRPGRWRVYPVEYKRGAPKMEDADRLQLAAQALCLEEMLACEIPEGALYYGQTRRRERVQLDAALRRKTVETILEMHRYFDRRNTPRAKRTRSCNACSLRDVCLPALGKEKSVADYIEDALG